MSEIRTRFRKLCQERTRRELSVQHLLPVGGHIPGRPGLPLLRPEGGLAQPGGRTHEVPGQECQREDH